jgi:ATP-dependent Lhr-like helicase
LGPGRSADERALAQARVLLDRYGVLSREAADQEAGPWDWGALYGQLQRMELRGEVRRGYFVAGLSGAQFALPEAVEELRAAAKQLEERDEVTLVSAADPALLGLPSESLPGSRLPSTYYVFWCGQPALVAEENGERLATGPEVPQAVIERAVGAFFDRPGAPRHSIVRAWDGQPVLGTPGEPLLAALGFYRSPAGMERWAGAAP